MNKTTKRKIETRPLKDTKQETAALYKSDPRMDALIDRLDTLEDGPEWDAAFQELCQLVRD